MTLRNRNIIIAFATSFVFAIYIAEILLSVHWFRTVAGAQEIDEFTIVAIKSGIPSFICLFGVLIFYRYFRKVTGPLIFFFFFALYTLAFDSAPAASFMIRGLGWSYEWPLTLTRIQLFATVAGTLSFFATSVYFSGVKYQHQGIVLIIILTVSYIIASLVPVSTGDTPVHGLFPAGFGSQLTVMCVLMIALTFLSFCRSAWANQRPEDILVGLMVAGMMSGRLVLSSGIRNPFALTVGALLLTGGALFYSRKVFTLYLWY